MSRPAQIRRVRSLAVIVGGVLLLPVGGCRHRQARPVVLPPQTAVPLVEVPTAENLPLVEGPNTKLPEVPVAQAAGKPKKVKKRPAKAPAQVAGTQTAATVGGAIGTKLAETANPAAKKDDASATLGALTVGGEQSPRALDDARDLITTNERRLAGLSGDTAKSQAELVSKVRTFQRDATQALQSGDAEGAKTLATKGKLLLDDMDRAGTP